MPSYDDISLGGLLVEAGLLKREDLDRAVRLLEALEKRGDSRQLHAVLAAEGLVDLRILRRALAHLRNETLRCTDCGRETAAADIPITAPFTCKGCSSELSLPEVISPSEIEMVTVTLDQIRMAEDQESLVGKTLGGVEIQKKLGQGGMGAVYRGVQVSLNRPVALKVLPPELVRSRQYVQRFTREAQAVALLNHPNVVQIFETGVERDISFIIMELVEGKSLGAILGEKGSLSLGETLDIMLQAAKALEAAGNRSIVHRDIKPDNILITQDGTAKVADFGLAKSTESGGSFTKTGQVLGTPAYMAPEQCEGRPADGRTDIYALGATFYHCLVGMPPFTGATPIAVLNKHVHEPLRPLSEVKPDLPPEICGVVERMLAKDPADRYANPGELVADLERLRGRQTQAVETRIQPAVAAAPRRRSSLLPIGIVAAVILIGGGILLWALGGLSGRDGGPTPPTGAGPGVGGLPPGTLEVLAPTVDTHLTEFFVEVRGEVAADIVRVEVAGSRVPIVDRGFSKRVDLAGPGEREITVRAVDSSGDERVIVRKVVVDIERPTLRIASPAQDLITSSERIEVTGTATDPYLAEVFINGGVVEADDGAYRGEVLLERGKNLIEVNCRDKAGNITTLYRNVHLDRTAPVVRVTGPAEGTWTRTPEVEVTVEVEEAHLDRVTVLDSDLRSLGDGRWGGPVALREGENTITVVALDRAGNRAETTRTIGVDSTAPSLTLTSPAGPDIRTREAILEVKGVVEDDHLATLQVSSRALEGRPGPFSSEVLLEEGENRVAVVAKDEAGNEARWEGRVLLDSTAPDIALEAIPQPPMGGGTITIRGRVSEAVEAVLVNDVTATLDGLDFAADLSASGETTQIHVRARDLAGNVGERKVEVTPTLPAGLAAGEREGEYENIKDSAPMVLIAAGSFRMGSDDQERLPGERCSDESPVHEVALSAYLIDRHEVTNGQYWLFLDWIVRTGDHGGCHPSEPAGHDHTPAYWEHEGWNLSDSPVVGVDWFDAYAYAAWAGKRLPTEAEWERAARGTEARRYPWGDEWDRERCNSAARWVGRDLPTREVWQQAFQEARPWSEKALTLPVESIAGGASPDGCHDMAGNVAEWTADWYEARYYAWAPKEDPKGPRSGSKRVARGGAWGFRDVFLRCADRGSLPPEKRALNLGFRCARDFSEE